MPFQSQYVNEDVLKKSEEFYKNHTKHSVGVTGSINKTPQTVDISLQLVMTNTLAGKTQLDNVFWDY